MRTYSVQTTNLLLLLQSDAIAFVVVSENFLWSRPFLKDSAALIRKAGGSQGKSNQSLHDLCRTGKQAIPSTIT